MPRPDPAAQGPATAIKFGEQVFLFDAGPGVMRQINAARLPIDGVTAFFATHLHSDHMLGYPDLIFTSWVMGRREALESYGPPGLRRMTSLLLEAFSEDIDIRINGYERGVPGGYRVNVHEIEAGFRYEKDGVVITAVPVRHGTWKHAFGYRIQAAGRTIVISGDCAPSEALVEAARGCDVLVHEVYPATRLAEEARPGGEFWPIYMRTFHTSDVEVGRIAATANVKLLVLHHIVRMGGTDEELIAGVRRGGFTGQVVIGRDLDRF